MVPALATKSNSTLSGAVLAVTPALACWAVIFWTIPAARQNFPLNDDAAYSAGLFALIRGEGIHYYRWAVMPQLGQWMWAAPSPSHLGPRSSSPERPPSRCRWFEPSQAHLFLGFAISFCDRPNFHMLGKLTLLTEVNHVISCGHSKGNGVSYGSDNDHLGS